MSQRMCLMTGFPLDFAADDIDPATGKKKQIQLLKMLVIADGTPGKREGFPIQEINCPLSLWDKVKGQLPCEAEVEVSIGGEYFDGKPIISDFKTLGKLALVNSDTGNLVEAANKTTPQTRQNPPQGSVREPAGAGAPAGRR